MSNFLVEKLDVNLDKKPILKNISLSIESGKISFLLGRNGAGKSTFAQSMIGNPNYSISNGSIVMDDKDILPMNVEQRSLQGLFVSFQSPPEIEGISLMNFLHTIYVEKFGNEDALSRSTFKFRKHVLVLLERVGLKQGFIDRSLNVGFSGGEKKRTEILQMLLLKPKYMILDEIDSGLDVHAVKILENAVSELIEEGSGVLYISHNVDFVKKYLDSKVYILNEGQIVYSGYNDAIEYFTGNKS